MPKRMLQDIIVPPRRPDARQRPRAETRSRHAFLEESFRRAASAPRKMFRDADFGDDNRRFFIWGAAALAVLAVLFTVFSFFQKATIKVTPRQERATLDAPFSASLGLAPGLTFEVMRLERAETKKLPATEVKNVSEKASGEITIFNAYNAQSQRLIKNTRFKTPDGLIYRISESVVVPGQKKVGGETVPGSATVTVYADEPGEKHNIGLADFTIPGFAGTPRFESFYARSKTPMEGGFQGVVKTVSDEKRSAAETELTNVLKEELLREAMSQKPDGYTLYEDAVFLSFVPSKRGAVGADIGKNEVEVAMAGTLEAIIFETEALSGAVGRALIPGLTADENVDIRNVDELVFTLHDKDRTIPASAKIISFSLKGSPYIVWRFDEQALKNDALGISKGGFRSLLEKYPAIQKAELRLWPFWKRSLPDDVARIEVETVIRDED